MRLDEQMREMKRRLAEEARTALLMVESALEALWAGNVDAAGSVRGRDDLIDSEEVRIEEICFRVMTLQQPVASDFRLIAFVLRVNADVERVADHACSIAKVAVALGQTSIPAWPTALREMGRRVPEIGHQVLRAMIDEDVELARSVLVGDATIDRLNTRLFDEIIELMETDQDLLRAGLLLYRAGRALERIGDLMQNIAEDIVYLGTGSIIRHEKKIGSAGRDRA